MVRMCADGVKPSSEKYLYGNALNAMKRIAREEGLGTFYKGLWPNVVRSVLMSKWKKMWGPNIGLTYKSDVSQIAV